MVIGSLTNFTGIFKYTLIIVFCPVLIDNPISRHPCKSSNAQTCLIAEKISLNRNRQ